jgi:8-oxo-dGTP pyrophosphatase MutT (NUDIX family)
VSRAIDVQVLGVLQSWAARRSTRVGLVIAERTVRERILRCTWAMSFLDRVRECNTYDLRNFLPFVVDGVGVGHVRKGVAEKLGRFPDVFAVRSESVEMLSDLKTPAERSEAMARVVDAFVADGVVKNVRGERYPVATAFGLDPMLEMERAAVPLFGVGAYGVHLNGYVRRGNEVHMWVARRSAKKQTYPGKLDQLVAGGQPIGITPDENLAKECWEEAAIPKSLARLAESVRPIHYCFEDDRGLHPNVLLCYDLELPIDFEPRPRDGEVERFHLWPIEQVMDTIASTDDFKANCNLVAIDFFIRHHFLAPAHPEYRAVSDLLNRRSLDARA